MRKAWIKKLTELAAKDERIFLLTGDLGYNVFEDFAAKFEDRFIDCGVAEQNMMGVAAGLALEGKKPYVYSIVPFVTLRCLEQIRDDVCYQNLDVKIIGVGGGFSYGSLGSTHSVLEDLAILRILPNMTVLCPSGYQETEELILKSYQTKNPTYIRLTNISQSKTDEAPLNLEIGRPRIFKKGKDGVIIATGVQVGFCEKAIEKLKEQGYDLGLISLHTLKPINNSLLLEELRGVKNVFTVEEHNVIGGLGGAVAEVLAESDWQGRLKIIGVRDEYSSVIGSSDYLREKYSIGEQGIIKNILNILKK